MPLTLMHTGATNTRVTTASAMRTGVTKTTATPVGTRPPAGEPWKEKAAGSLTDIDLLRETAQLTDLRDRQDAQGTAGNCTPQTLLSLFGNA